MQTVSLNTYNLHVRRTTEGFTLHNKYGVHWTMLPDGSIVQFGYDVGSDEDWGQHYAVPQHCPYLPTCSPAVLGRE